MNREFHELLIEGPGEFLRGLVEGYVAARAPRGEVIFGEDFGFADDGVLQRVKELLHLSQVITHVIADAETAELVREAVRAETEHPLTIRSDRVVESAYFEYDFAVYNAETGALLQKALDDLPAGVTITEREQSLSIDPQADDRALYSPAHRYEFTGRGKVQGPVDKIAWTFKQLRSFEQLNAEPIRTIYRAP